MHALSKKLGLAVLVAALVALSGYTQLAGAVEDAQPSAELGASLVADPATVSDSGAMTTRVPIEVMPDRLTPQLSLTYGSETPHSTAGVGWQLGGLSAIARMPWPNPSEYDADDAFGFMPNGWQSGFPGRNQRLVEHRDPAIAASSPLANRWYTYEDDMAYHTPHGACGDGQAPGPCYWVRHAPDGMVFHYGGDASANAGTVSNGAFHGAIWGRSGATRLRGIQAWLLTRVQDRFGNYFTIDYDGGVPYRVRYALRNSDDTNIADPGCSASSQTSCRTIEFGYVVRNDITPVPQRSNHLLSEIRMGAGNPVRFEYRYRLMHDISPDSGRNRLTQVRKELCVANCSQSAVAGYAEIERTTFSYTTQLASGQTVPSPLVAAPRSATRPALRTDQFTPTGTDNFGRAHWITEARDVDGDGFGDILSYPYVTQEVWGRAIHTARDFHFFPGGPNGLSAYRVHSRPAARHGEGEISADLNGDGLQDKVFYRVRADVSLAQPYWRYELGLASGGYADTSPDHPLGVPAQLGDVPDHSPGIVDFNFDQADDVVVHAVWPRGARCPATSDPDDPECPDVTRPEDRRYRPRTNEFRATSRVAWGLQRGALSTASFVGIATTVTSAGALAAEIDTDPQGVGASHPLIVPAHPVADGVQSLTAAFAPNVGIDFDPVTGTHRARVRHGFDARDLRREEYPSLKEQIVDVTGDGYPEHVVSYIGSRVNGDRSLGQWSTPSQPGVSGSTDSFAFGMEDRAPWQPGDPLPPVSSGPGFGCIPDRVGDTRYCTDGNGTPITEWHRATWQIHDGDVTGDRISDRVFVYRGLMGQYLYYQAGSPTGFGPLVRVQELSAARSSDNNARADGDRAQTLWVSALGDVNGDGLMDVVLGYFGDHARDGGLKLELSLGSPGGPRVPIPVYGDTTTRTRNYYAGRWNTPPYTRLRLLDINGDGLMDPLISNELIPDPYDPPVFADATKMWYWLTRPGAPDLLRTVTSPLGGSTTVSYEASNQHERARQSVDQSPRIAVACDSDGCTTYDSQPHYLVSNLRRSNGFPASDGRAVIRDTAFRYFGPRRRLSHFTTNGAMGYASRTVEDKWLGTSTETRYRQHVDGAQPEQVMSMHGADLRSLISHAPYRRLTPHAGTFAWVPTSRVDASFVLSGADPTRPFGRTTTSYAYRATGTSNRAHYAFLAPESVTTDVNGQRTVVAQTYFADDDTAATATAPSLYRLERVTGSVRYLRDAADTAARRLVLDAHYYVYQSRRYLNRDVPMLVRHDRLRHGNADQAYCFTIGSSVAQLRDTCNRSNEDTGIWHVIESGHRYDAFGHLTSVVNALGGTTMFSYADNLGRNALLASTTDAAGNTTAQAYDQRGRIVTATDANQQVTTYRYSTAHGRLERVLPPGTGTTGTQSHRYLNLGTPGTQRIETTYYDTPTSSYRSERFLDGNGDAWKSVTHRADRSVATFAEYGRVLRNQAIVGSHRRTSIPVVDAATLDPNTLEWDTTLSDGFGRERFVGRIRRTGSSILLNADDTPQHVQKRHSSTTYTVDAQGRLEVTVTDSKGSRGISRSDPLGYLREVEDAAGGRLIYVYGAAGVLRSSGALTAIEMPIDASGEPRAIGLQPDSWGNIRVVTDPDLGRLSHRYDAAGNKSRSEDSLGRVTVVAYDRLGRPQTETRTPAPATGAWDIASVRYNYDGAAATLPSGAPLANRRGRLSGWTLHGPALNGSTELYEEAFGYDARGNLETRAKTYLRPASPGVTMPAPQVFRYGYDWQGRALNELLPDGTKLAWTYQPDGLLTSSAVNGRPLANGFVYNARGQVTARTNPALGVTESYGYWPGDAWLQSRTATDSQGRRVVDYWYDYDAVGNIYGIIDSHDTGAGNSDTQMLGYDPLNRLSSASGVAYGNQSYTFDAHGNFTQKEGIYYSYGACGALRCMWGTTAPVQIGGTPGPGILLWEERRDAVGNRTQFTTFGTNSVRWTYKYNHANQLAQVLRDGVETGRYGYDAKGQRLWKLVTDSNGQPLVTYYVDRDYELRGSALAPAFATTARLGNDVTVNGGANLPTQPTRADVYTNQGAPLVGTTQYGLPQGTWFHFGNHLGSTTATLGEGSTGVPAADVSLPATRYIYTPYGNVVRPSSGTPSASQGYDQEVRTYTGQEYDPENALHYYNARYYDARTGRFLTADTYTPGNGFSLQGLNRYAYARNNPFRFVDPSGHQEVQTSTTGSGKSSCFSGSVNSPGGAVCPQEGKKETTSNEVYDLRNRFEELKKKSTLTEAEYLELKEYLAWEAWYKDRDDDTFTKLELKGQATGGLKESNRAGAMQGNAEMGGVGEVSVKVKRNDRTGKVTIDTEIAGGLRLAGSFAVGVGVAAGGGGEAKLVKSRLLETRSNLAPTVFQGLLEDSGRNVAKQTFAKDDPVGMAPYTRSSWQYNIPTSDVAASIMPD